MERKLRTSSWPYLTDWKLPNSKTVMHWQVFIQISDFDQIDWKARIHNNTQWDTEKRPGNFLFLGFHVYKWHRIMFVYSNRFVMRTARAQGVGQRRKKRACLGPNWSCWAEVGAKAIQMDPKLQPCDAHGSPSQVQSGEVWHGDTSWGTLLQNVVDTSESTSILKLSYWAGCVHLFEAIWTSTWAEVAPKWVQVGAILEPS